MCYTGHVTIGVQTLDQRVEPLLTRFRLAAVADRTVERRAMIYLALTAVTGVVAAICLFVACGIAVEARKAAERQTATWLAAVGGGAFALSIGFGVRRRAWKRLDLDNRKLQALLRVLAILRADIARSERVSMTADLRDTRQGGALVSRESVGASTVSRYRHAWLTLAARLADGNSVALSVVDHLKVKQKRRTRYVCTTDVDLSIRLDQRYRGAVPALVNLLGRRKLPYAVPAGVVPPSEGQGRPPRETFRLTGVHAAPNGGAIKLALKTPRLPDPSRLPDGDVLLGVLRWFYGSLGDACRLV
jgi:hypothetical protein